MLNINTVLSNLNTNYAQVTDLVPEIFYFTDDVSEYQSNDNMKVHDTVVQDDGKILMAGEGIAGWGNNNNAGRRAGVMRINSDGTVDDTYARLDFDQDSIFAVDLQSTGKAIVAGYFQYIINGEGGGDNYYANNIVRLETSGYPDGTFNIGTGFDNDVEDIIVLSNNSILACGYFGLFNGVVTGHLTKLNSNGTLNTGFNLNFIDNELPASGIHSMAVQSDNKIVFVGDNGFVSRIGSDGLHDGSFSSPTIDGSLYTVAIQDDGKILVGGDFTTVNGNTVTSICRLNSDGSFDASFAPVGNGFQYYNGGGYSNSSILDIKTQSDGKILVGGYFNSYNSELRNYICRLNSDGTIDSSFGNPYDFDKSVLSINYISSNSILVGGNFRHPRIGFVKLTSTGSFSTFGINLPNDTYGIHDGGPDIYDDANFINTNNTQLYNDITAGDVVGSLSIPSTHVQANDDNAYDASSPYDRKYIPSPLTSVIRNGSFYKMPDWMETFSNDQVGYGFDQNGMWFVNNADGTTYPIRSNFDIADTDTCVITFTFIHDTYCSDQGICVYKADTPPEWYWGTNGTRIALSYNCPAVYIYGQSAQIQDVADLVDGQTYTAKATYNPIAGTFTAETYLGTSATGTPISTISLSESLPAGNYRVAFCADQDGVESGADANNKSYFTYVSIEVGSSTYVMEKQNYFGSTSSQYFTQMYPGMFVMAATGIDISEFSITGNLGSDGEGVDAAEIFPLTSSGKNYTAFFKTNYGGGDPSINHFIIVPGNSTGITHLYDNTSDWDDDCLQGLTGKDEIYYFVVTRGDENAITLEEATIIAQKFLDVITAGTTVELCTPITCNAGGLPCQLPTNCTCPKSRLFAAGCSLRQSNSNACSTNNAAYVPAITVCRQRLF